MELKINIKKANHTTYRIKKENGEIHYIDVSVKKNKKLIDFLISNAT